MSTNIFYFTGTGNCLKVAQDLARELGDARIFSIPRVINGDIASAERIGLVYPVYMFGMPLIVNRFISRLKGVDSGYIFAIATCGGKAGNTLLANARILKAQGQELSAGFIVKMPGNYTPLYGALPTEKQEKLFEQEGRRVKEIAVLVKEKLVQKAERDMSLFGGLFSLIYRLGSPKIPVMDRGFWSDSKCNSCGICVKVCPVRNIELFEGRPKWFHKCEQCFACLHWCPQEAIQHGKSTPGRKRYRHPLVTVKDIAF